MASSASSSSASSPLSLTVASPGATAGGGALMEARLESTELALEVRAEDEGEGSAESVDIREPLLGL